MSWYVLDRKDNETFHCTLGKVVYDVSPSFIDHGNSMAYIRSRSGLYTHCLPSRETQAPELDLLDGEDHAGRWVIHAPPESSGVLSSCVGYGCDGQLQGVAALTLAPRQLVVGWGEAGDVFPWPPRHVHLEKENVEDVNRANRIFDELFRPFSPHGVVREARFQFPDGIPRHLCLCLGPNASNFAMGYCKVGDRSGVVRVRSFDPSDEEDYRLNLGRRADTGLSIDNILANVLIRHVGPFIDDTHDWLNFMAVTPVMYQQSQIMSTDPPLPRCIRTESFIPTALLFTPDDKSILVGTSTGEIRVFHRRRGFLPTSFGTSDLAQLVRSSGPILGLDIVHSSGDMRLAVAQKKRITLWVRDVEEGSWTPQVDLSYVLDDEDVESLENANRFSGDILDLACAESSSQSIVQTCHLVKDESGDPAIQVQFKLLRNQRYERTFFSLSGDPIRFPSFHADEGNSRSVTGLPPVHAHHYGDPGSEDALDQWVLLVPPIEQDVVSICSYTTADNRTVVATANSEGVVKELSGNPIHKMVALPRGFNSMWEYMEWLGYDDYEVTIGTISPAVAPCLKYSFDGSMLGAGYDLGDGNGQIELWTIGERGKEDDGSDSDYDDDESFDY